jgi:acyl-CoA synthetase (NDP forming)
MPADVHDARDVAAGIVEGALRAGRPALDEAAAKQVLAAYGIPVPAGGVVHSALEAVDLAAALGGPVALKAAGALIQHKTEAGLVLLDLRTPDEVGAGYAILAERAGDALEGVLVEQMVAGSREFLIGMKRDAAFGPVVTFGLGGTMTEVFRDIVLAIPPIADDDVSELLGLIKSRALLGSFRGLPAVDRDKLVAIFQAVARLAAEQPRIAEIDVNPLLIAGDSPVAADALIVLGAEAPQAPENRAFTPDLEAVLAPRSVAIVGASDDVVKWGGSALKNIMAGGFEGAIYPIHPKGGEFFGLPVYPSLADTPEPPDMALLAVGAARVPDMVAECGARGVRSAVAIAAGFAETGEAGEDAERTLAQTADEAGVTLIGPNCMGIIANATSLHATGFIALHPRPGKLAIVSQSGNLGVQLTELADRRDVGVRCFIGVGNEAQVSAVDVVDYLSRDDGTASVLVYLEGIDDGRQLLDVARATGRKKPVVVLRGGLTEHGGKAAASHTGAMAGSAAVYEAAARQAGLVTCTSVQEALDLTICLAHLPLPRGRRMAIVTNGGGAGVLAADEMSRHELTLVDPPQGLLDELDTILPPFWSRRNPIDMVAMAGGDVAHRVLSAVAKSPAVDGIVVLSVLGVPNTGDEVRSQSLTGDYDDFSPWEKNYLDLVADLMRETGKPIINVPDLPLRRALHAGDHLYTPVVVSTPRNAALVLARMASYGAWRHDTNPRPKDPA